MRVKLMGGPLHGQRLFMSEPCSGTLKFRIGEHVGRYVAPHNLKALGAEAVDRLIWTVTVRG